MKRITKFLIVLLVALLLCPHSAEDPKDTAEDIYILSVEQLVNNVCDYITTNSIAYNKEQNFESLHSLEMSNLTALLYHMEIMKPNANSVALSRQELRVLQKYMTETSLPYDYALPIEVEIVIDIVNAETARDPENAIRIWQDYLANTFTYPYKVCYYYQSETGNNLFITIDYDGNLFLSTVDHTFKVELAQSKLLLPSY